MRVHQLAGRRDDLSGLLGSTARIAQATDTADMIYDVATLIAALSEGMTLEPGDVIATCTPSGVGYARTPPVFMKSGDVCEIKIERIGTLSNTVARRAAF